MCRSCPAFSRPWTGWLSWSPSPTSYRCHSCQSTFSGAHVLQHFSIFQHPSFSACLSEGDMSWPVIHTVLFRRGGEAVCVCVWEWGGFNFISGTSSSWEVQRAFSLSPAMERHVPLCHSGVARSRSTLDRSLPAFLLFWSGKRTRDSNLHFNYIAQVIRCYLALVIECAVRQPSTAVKQPPESHGLTVCVQVCVCVHSSYLCLPMRVCVRERERVCEGTADRPKDRHGSGSISVTRVFGRRVQCLTSACHCPDCYHYI